MIEDLEVELSATSLSTPPRPHRSAPAPSSGAPEPAAGRRDRLERWIYALEDLVRIPGTRVTFGLDAVLGLLPVVGDFAGLVCGLPVVVLAVRRRLPFAVVLAMVANLLIDAVFGVVPLLGNLFDLLWKSHRKNLHLLDRPEGLGEVLREARWKLSALAAIVVLLAAAMVGLVAFAIWGLARLHALLQML